MGCYDTIWIKCPRCGTQNGFQSKGGECMLRNYDESDDIPLDVLGDVNRHSPIECQHCGFYYSARVIYSLKGE